MITTNPLSNGLSYSASLAPILTDLEGVVPTVYVDSNHLATIGAGFLVSANVGAVLSVIDPSLQTILLPSGYQHLQTAIVNATRNVKFANPLAAQTAIQGAIYNALTLLSG